jgi:hypothetical protein
VNNAGRSLHTRIPNASTRYPNVHNRSQPPYTTSSINAFQSGAKELTEADTITGLFGIIHASQLFVWALIASEMRLYIQVRLD